MRRIATCLLALLWLCPPLFAKEELATFGEVVDVHVINLEVVVTNRQGERVPGLPAEAFTLLVDDKPVNIQYFSEIREGKALGTGTSQAVVSPVSAGTEVGTSYLVFVDDFFARASERNQVLDEIQASYGQLGPNDRLAMVAWDGRRLTSITTWTGSSLVADSAFRMARDRPASGSITEFNQRQALVDRRDTPTGPGAFAPNAGPTETGLSLGLPIDRRALEIARDVTRSASAAAGAMRGLAPTAEGRRVLLLLSGGWPFDPYAVAAGDQSANPGRMIPRGRELIQPMLEAANLLSYTIYGVDVPGLRAGGGADATQEAAVGDFENLLETEHHDLLQLAAKETGGLALINAERLEALSAPIEDTRSYYWLGVSLERSGKGKAHDLEVRVSDPALEVRARQDFVDLSRENEVALTLESALSFGEATLPDASLQVVLGQPKKSGVRRMKVPATIVIPFGDVTIEPAGKAWKVELELRVGAFDEEGNLSEVPLVPIKLDLPTRPHPSQFARYDTELVLRRADQELILALVDPRTLTMKASPTLRLIAP